MKSFKDAAGRTWIVAMNIDTLKRCKSLCNVDLMQIVAEDAKLLGQLMSEPILLCDVIFALCKEDADKLGVNDSDFGKAMDGAAIAAATQALLDEIADFFLKRTKRDLIGKVLEKMKKVESLTGQKAMAKLEDPELDVQLEEAVAKAFRDGRLPGNAPASSE